MGDPRRGEGLVRDGRDFPGVCLQKGTEADRWATRGRGLRRENLQGAKRKTHREADETENPFFCDLQLAQFSEDDS